MNLQMLQANQVKTMSSREIANLCEKQHKNVVRDICTMLECLEIDALRFEHIYFDSMNRAQTEYLLDKDLTLTLVAGYSAPIRYRIIQRWQELEQAATPAIPQSFSEALLLAGELQKQIEQDAPKVAHYDNVVNRRGLLNATQVAQKLHMSAVAMNKVLAEIGVYNKAVKRSRVFQQWFITEGFGVIKQTNQGHSQALFTTKGEAWVVERLISEGVA